MKISRILPLLLLICTSLSGCDRYYADIPEFTTNHNRITDFQPKTFEKQHETSSYELEELRERVKKGIEGVDEKAGRFAASSPESELSSEIQSFRNYQ